VIETMRERLRQLGARIDDMSLRERALIFIALLVVFYLVATNLVFAPVTAERGRVERDLKAKREKTLALEAQIQGIFSGEQGQGQARMAALESELKSLETRLSGMTTGLISPQEMTRVVEQILTRNRTLEVIRVESLAARPILENTPGAARLTGATVYKHGMRIELKGRYLDILTYLHALEGLPWKVYWSQVTLDVKEPPMATVTLVIHTLSFKEGWIGV